MTCLDGEILSLYKSYLQAINGVVSNIETGETLSGEEYALTKIGTVKVDENMTILSPFHPTLVSFMLEFASRFDNKDYQSKELPSQRPYARSAKAYKPPPSAQKSDSPGSSVLFSV